MALADVVERAKQLAGKITSVAMRVTTLEARMKKIEDEQAQRRKLFESKG